MIEPSISIIIITKDRPEIFEQTYLSAVDAADKNGAEIIVVNDSKIATPTLPIITSFVRLVNSPKNGVAAARNLGASLANAANLLFVDDDIIFNSKELKYVLDFLASHNSSCINLNWEYPPELLAKCTTTTHGRYRIKNQLVSLRGWRKEVSWSNTLFEAEVGASYFLGISYTDFGYCGGYNEAFPHSGFEDYEFNMRLQKNKIKLFIEPNFTVLHNEADKLELAAWLKRKYQGAITIRIGYELGFRKLDPTKGSLKTLFYKFLSPFEKHIYWSITKIPNNKTFDFIAFRGINLLLGLILFKGFRSNQVNTN